MIDTPDAAVSPTDFRDGMARLAGAVTVLATDGPAGLAGMTASAVCSVTDSPPTLLVCMNRGSFAHPTFAANGVLCVNVLGGDQQAVSALFADRAVGMAERFARSPWQALATGAPALDGAPASFDGDIVQSHDVGTHSVLIVRLRAIRVRDGAPSGLAWFDRGYHALGVTAGVPVLAAA